MTVVHTKINKTPNVIKNILISGMLYFGIRLLNDNIVSARLSIRVGNIKYGPTPNTGKWFSLFIKNIINKT